MSYILDALRRADAERERGAVPGIHAQQLAAHAPGPPPGTAPWVWMAGGAALLLAAIVAWQLLIDHEPPPLPVEALTPPPPAPGPQRPPSPPPRAPATAVTLPPIVVAPERPRAAAPEPARKAAAASAPVDARVPMLQDLPEPLRRQIPAMSIGGSIYSENPASRFLIINGQIFHEGNKVTPDLVLEQIRLKSAVMRFKETRFGVSY